MSVFRFKHFNILNNNIGLKVTTDACILGAIANFNGARSILDIGTGNGLLSLMIAQKHTEAMITAVEIDYNVMLLAKRNFENSIYKNQISVIAADINECVFEKKFDGIICNPPFFNNHLLGKTEAKNKAMHTLSLNYLQLAKVISKNISNSGICWIIYPPHEFELFQSVCHPLTMQEQINVYNLPGKLFRIIACFGLQNTPLKVTDLLIKDNNNQYTSDYKKIMQPYYLSF